MSFRHSFGGNYEQLSSKLEKPNPYITLMFQFRQMFKTIHLSGPIDPVKDEKPIIFFFPVIISLFSQEIIIC